MMPTTNETSNRYLIDEYPLIVLPSLVMVLDRNVNLAMLLQQVHFWLGIARQSRGKSGKFENGRWWVYNSITGWNEQLPFLSKRTIERLIARLCNLGVLIKEEVNPQATGGSRTWFSIDYDCLNKLVSGDRHRADTSADEGDRHGDDTPYRHRADPFTYALDPDTQELQNQQSGFAANAAAKTGLPAALPSVLPSVPPRKRSEEKRVKSEEQSQTRIPLDDLTPLGKEIIALCGKGTALAVKPFLTQAQADKLSEEYSVPYKGENYLLTPDDLYESEPLYRAWIETEVYSTLRAQGGDKPLAKDKFISAITMGSTVLNLSEFLAWREQQIDKQEMVSALTDPAKVGEGRFSMLEEYEKMSGDSEEEGEGNNE